MCSKKMLYGAIKVYTNTGGTEKPKRMKRARKTTVREDRLICRLSKENHFFTTKDIHSAIPSQMTSQVTPRTKVVPNSDLPGCRILSIQPGARMNGLIFGGRISA